MNIKLIFIMSISLFIAQQCEGQNSAVKSVTKNQMNVEWAIIGDQLHVSMQAPTEGWIAIGFNTEAGLSGTSLLMGRIRNGKAEVVDHFVQAPGQYQPVIELGGSSAVSAVSGKEKESYSQVSFQLTLDPGGTLHQQLISGKRYHLLLAYSRDDDFAHHSMMRTSIEIEL